MNYQEIPPFTSPMESEFNNAIRWLSADKLKTHQMNQVLYILKELNLIRTDFTADDMLKCMEEYHKES